MEQGSLVPRTGAQSQEEIPKCQQQGLSPSLLRPSVVIQVDSEDPLGLNKLNNDFLCEPGALGRKNGNGDSPESASLYSDEIPSGYNSGEQYDTLSTGYMSGEAYELPETRMELREPALDPIEEGRGSIGMGAANSDDNIFVHIATEVGAVPGLSLNKEDKASVNSTSTTSSSDDENGEAMIEGPWNSSNPVEANVLHMSPMAYSGVKSKMRKKVTTFAIHETDLASGDRLEQYESSDVGVGSGSGGYRAVPSDTDTSAMDSDGNAVLSDNSAIGLLRAAHRQHRSGVKRARKNFLHHDENWFNNRDNKYWSTTRTICFWLSMTSMLSSIVAAAILIALMPTKCDPDRKWFQGGVLMDFRVTHSSDLIAMESRLDHLGSVGINALHLRDVTLKTVTNATAQYHPTSMTVTVAQQVLADGAEYDPLGDTPLKRFTAALHAHNMSLIVQVPVLGFDSESQAGRLSISLQHKVEDAIKYWSEQGADGVFLEGLEHFGSDSWVGRIVSRWHEILERYGNTDTRHHEKVLMTSYTFAHNLAESGNTEGREALKYIDLLDATLDLSSLMANLTETSETIENMAKWDASEERPWINWNLQFVRNLPMSNAAAAFQMLLPGTVNIGSLSDNNIDDEQLRNMTSLRTVAVPIYMNGNYKRCDCEEGTTKEKNYLVHHPIKDVVQLERFYSRRNRYVLIANFGNEPETLQGIGRIYTGGELVLDTSSSLAELNTHVLFKHLTLPPGQAVVIKIPK